MKFKQIRMTNFMRYKGDVVIDFSVDPEKNVTVILGDNAFGKTTIAQAFRWGLYGEVATTNYTNRKDVTLLNNEVIASMDMNAHKSVEVEITVLSDSHEYKFRRRQMFRRKSQNPAIYSVVPVTSSSLQMQLTDTDGKVTDWISNDGDGKNFKPNCVNETIANMFPQKLSSYFFFDGERWNNDQNSGRKEDVRKSINTILGISSVLRMKEHLKDGTPGNRSTVIRDLHTHIKGSTDEAKNLKASIERQEDNITKQQAILEQKTAEKAVAEEDIQRYGQILQDGKKAEEDQKELHRLEERIKVNENYRNSAYADLVRQFSNIDRYLAASLLPAIDKELSSIDLEGKDIPGVTSDTIDWLIEYGKCLCGADIEEGNEHYNALMQLREEVYPNKLGGPAKVFKGTLAEWRNDTDDLLDLMHEKADLYETAQTNVDSDERSKAQLEEKIDKKQNMEAVRKQYNLARANKDRADREIAVATASMEGSKKQIESLQNQLRGLEAQDKANRPFYLAISYAEELYKLADQYVDKYEKPTVAELNELIQKNFEKMFDSKDKYAKLDNDYQVRLYYRSLVGTADYEEENISVGERVSLNFAYIVSILELAEKRRLQDNTSDAVLSLPLVLDAPFSNLSSENTGTVAAKLPEFAEQVIIFMLDKDLEASGLNKFTDSQYRYRVTRDLSENNSTIILDQDLGGEI